MAHKKAVGSSRNGRDSNGQRLGTKVYGGQTIRAGGIIVRQRGAKILAGENTRMGKDHTIYATKDGVVVFGETRNGNFTGKRSRHTTVSVQSDAGAASAKKAKPAKKTSAKSAE